jgi:GMP synthase (glutamine-hydrolysing)
MGIAMMGSGTTVLALQHVAGETAGLLQEVLEGEGLQIATTRIFEGQAVPDDPDEAAGLVILGGPMGVYELDRYPHLADEIRLIERAVRRRVPVLGICLGSQLLAAALGAGVSRARAREIGWHEVALRDEAAKDRLWRGIESPFTAFHWHGDVFGLPRGAVSLARSAATEHQAFRHGERAYGLLFHLETTPAIVEAMVADGREDLRQEAIDPRSILEGVRTRLPAVQAIGRTVLGRWAELVRERA